MVNEKKAAVKTLNGVSLSLSETKQGYWIIAKVIIKSKGCYNAQYKNITVKLSVAQLSFYLSHLVCIMMIINLNILHIKIIISN